MQRTNAVCTHIGIIAGDLTGALDTAFVDVPGNTTVLLSLSAEVTGDNVAIVTNSHAMSPEEAYAAVRSAAQRLHGYWLLKKVDSTLRGNIGPEIRAVLDETGARAVVCPALPREGRTVVGGIGLHNSVPVHLTEYGRHPTVPCRESSLLTILRNSGIRAESVVLDQVREGVHHLGSLLTTSNAEAVVLDAATDEDLSIIAGALAPLEPSWFACGSSGLTPHLSRALGNRDFQRCEKPLAAHPTTVAVMGSMNSATARQVSELVGRDDARVIGVEALALCRGGSVVGLWEATAQEALRDGRRAVVTTSLSTLVPSLHDDVAPRLGTLAARIVQQSDATAVVVSGGHTGWCTCDSLGIDALEVLGQVEPGVVCSRGTDRSGTSRTVVSKAGGFGDARMLVRLLQMGPAE